MLQSKKGACTIIYHIWESESVLKMHQLDVQKFIPVLWVDFLWHFTVSRVNIEYTWPVASEVVQRQLSNDTSNIHPAPRSSTNNSTMAATPRNLVHWALDVSISDFGSPYSEATSSDSVASTSSLQYISSQLVAHGFTPSPGLSFEGLSNSDTDKVARCLLAMLSQRAVRWRSCMITQVVWVSFKRLEWHVSRRRFIHQTTNSFLWPRTPHGDASLSHWEDS